MLWVYDHCKYVYSCSVGIDFRRQNLTSTDVRFWRQKCVLGWSHHTSRSERENTECLASPWNMRSYYDPFFLHQPPLEIPFRDVWNISPAYVTCTVTTTHLFYSNPLADCDSAHVCYSRHVAISCNVYSHYDPLLLQHSPGRLLLRTWFGCWNMYNHYYPLLLQHFPARLVFRTCRQPLEQVQILRPTLFTTFPLRIVIQDIFPATRTCTATTTHSFYTIPLANCYSAHVASPWNIHLIIVRNMADQAWAAEAPQPSNHIIQYRPATATIIKTKLI